MEAKFDQFVGIFEDAVPEEFCQSVIDYFDITHDLNKTVSRKEQGVPNIIKDDNIYGMCDETDVMILKTFTRNLKPLASALGECYQRYIQEYSILTNIARHRISETYQIQRTKPGEGYHVWHCEADSLTSASRIAVPIIYLNTIEEGGETEFLYQKMRVKPKQGTIVLFPAAFTHVHRGNPPLKEDKYIVTSWIEFLG